MPKSRCDPLMNLDAADFAARPGIEAAFEARVSADTESDSNTRISAASAASEGVLSAECRLTALAAAGLRYLTAGSPHRWVPCRS